MTVTLYLQKAEPVLFDCKANKGSDNIRGPPLPATQNMSLVQILTQACYCFAKCSNSFEQGAHPWQRGAGVQGRARQLLQGWNLGESTPSKYMRFWGFQLS